MICNVCHKSSLFVILLLLCDVQSSNVVVLLKVMRVKLKRRLGRGQELTLPLAAEIRVCGFGRC